MLLVHQIPILLPRQFLFKTFLLQGTFTGLTTAYVSRVELLTLQLTTNPNQRLVYQGYHTLVKVIWFKVPDIHPHPIPFWDRIYWQKDRQTNVRGVCVPEFYMF